jgi:RNA polymerase sigma-70 factor (ECF subfamily)
VSEAYRPGNAEDFDRLYRDSHRRLVQTVVGMLGDPAAAEDCVQETFVRAFRSWPKWKPDAPAEAWLHRIAIRLAISHRRYEVLRSPAEVVRRLGPPVGAPDRDLGLIDALRLLPLEEAAILVLRHHHGYSNREIAAAMDAPESTVSSRLATARRHLEGLLEREPAALRKPRSATAV